MSHLWMLHKHLPPAVSTVLGLLFVCTLFIVAVFFKNMPVDPVSARPVSLFSTIFLFWGRTSGLDFSE